MVGIETACRDLSSRWWPRSLAVTGRKNRCTIGTPRLRGGVYHPKARPAAHAPRRSAPTAALRQGVTNALGCGTAEAGRERSGRCILSSRHRSGAAVSSEPRFSPGRRNRQWRGPFDGEIFRGTAVCQDGGPSSAHYVKLHIVADGPKQPPAFTRSRSSLPGVK